MLGRKKTEKKPRAKKVEPIITDAEIQRLKDILAKEEYIEAELKFDMEQVIKNRDRALSKHLQYIEQKNRRLIMWIGIVFCMLVIGLFWLASFRASTASLVQGSSAQVIDVNEAKQNLTEGLQKILSTLDDLKKQSNEINTSTSSTSTSPFPATEIKK